MGAAAYSFGKIIIYFQDLLCRRTIFKQRRKFNMQFLERKHS